jgi:Fe-S-cluster containining protein
MADTPLVCGLCRECCVGPRALEIDEPSWLYRTYQKNGATLLATGANGDCIYLEKNGCSIYECRPQACRDFDCRDYVEDARLPARMRVEALRRIETPEENS